MPITIKTAGQGVRAIPPKKLQRESVFKEEGNKIKKARGKVIVREDGFVVVETKTRKSFNTANEQNEINHNSNNSETVFQKTKESG